MEALGAGAGRTPVGGNFSGARSVAVAVIARRLTHEELDAAWLRTHEPAIGELAGRIRVRHDWQQTLRTLQGPLDAGATLADVPATAWPRLLRHFGELRGETGPLGWRELARALTGPEVRRRLPGLLRRRAGAGLGALDTSALRMSFPA